MHTNSLVNILMSNGDKPTPVVGMGCTRLAWTDRHAFTVVEVVNTKTIKVRQDHAKRIDTNGVSESQTYEYTADPNAPIITVTLRKNGRWVEKGESAKHGTAYSIGSRNEYHDFSF